MRFLWLLVVLAGSLAAQPVQKVRTPFVPDWGQVPVEQLEQQARDFAGTFVLQGPETEKLVALTFDDGPSNLTPALLDLLQQKAVKATFFVLGVGVKYHSTVLQRMVAEGHTVANHSWDHPYLTKLPTATYWKAQVGRTQEALAEVLGLRPRLFRPPYGFLDDPQVRDFRAQGMVVAAWSVASDDWLFTAKRPAAEASAAILDQVVTYAHPGAIVLLHDAGGKTRRPTLEAVGSIIDRLRAQGYRFVTVDALLGVSPYL